jgi:hypothetical protein
MLTRPHSAVVVAAGRGRPSPRRLRLPLHAASKGFGASSSKPPPPPPKKKPKTDGGGKSDAGTSSARVKTADPDVQRSATLLLTALVAETDPDKRYKIASDNVDKIDGVFFAVADAYVKLARGEAKNGGDGGSGGSGEEVAAGLEAAVKCALDAKQATLRPEIRLLNQLLDAPSLEARRAVLEAPSQNGASGALLLKERASREYLNQLLDTFQKDVEAQAKAAAAKGGDVSAVDGLKRAIEETQSIVLAAAAAAAAASGGGSGGGGGKS